MILNSFHDAVNFALPKSPDGIGWDLLLDTNAPDQEKRPSFKFGKCYQVTGRSLLLFSSAFGLVRAVRSPNAAQNVQAAFRRVHAPRDTSAVRTGVY